jgi:hypothetical protein
LDALCHPVLVALAVSIIAILALVALVTIVAIDPFVNINTIATTSNSPSQIRCQSVVLENSALSISSVLRLIT